MPQDKRGDNVDAANRFRLGRRRDHPMLREAIERVHLDGSASFAIGRNEALLHFQGVVSIIRLRQHEYSGSSTCLSCSTIVWGLPSAMASSVFQYSRWAL